MLHTNVDANTNSTLLVVCGIHGGTILLDVESGGYGNYAVILQDYEMDCLTGLT